MSTYPVDITSDKILEIYNTVTAICFEALGRNPPWDNINDLVCNTMMLMAFEGKTYEELRIWLHEQPEAIIYRNKVQESTWLDTNE